MYQVYIADCAGVRDERHFETFGQALAFYQWITDEARRRKDAIGMVNLNRCDYDSDGLTDEEREQVDG